MQGMITVDKVTTLGSLLNLSEAKEMSGNMIEVFCLQVARNLSLCDIWSVR